jgi:predicted DNA-binding protein (UPF0251 family)
MSRCKKHRCCRCLGNDRIFKPAGVPFHDLPINSLGLDEFEAVRLCDHEKLSQIEAAERMQVSRGTVQRLLEKGRFLIADALLNNRALVINNAREEEKP